MTPKRLLTMPDVIRALTQGAPVRVQIYDVTLCQTQTTDSSSLPLTNFAHDVESARIGTTPGNTTAVIANEETVVVTKGQNLNLSGPAIRQVNIQILENGTMDIDGTTRSLMNDHVVTSWRMVCQWDNRTSKDSAWIYQQDTWGEEMSEFQSLKAAVDSGYALALSVDLTLADPPGEGVWIGKIHGINLWNQSGIISVVQRCVNSTSVTVMSVAVPSTDKVSISEFTYNRSSGAIVSHVQRTGFFNFKGSVHIFKLSYQT